MKRLITYFDRIAILFVVLTLITFSLTGLAHVITKVRYVKIDHHAHTAYLYDENFKKLSDSDYVAKTSMEKISDTLWLLGFKVDVIRRLGPHKIKVVSNDPRYNEMSHHFVFGYSSPNKTVIDECTVARPIGNGSELSDVQLPTGYAYKMPGGVISGLSWHWTNPAGLADTDEIYLRYIMYFDKTNVANSYKDVHVRWIDAVPCQSEFAIPAGKSTRKGPEQKLTRKMRLVAALPHIHDHATSFKLTHNGNTLKKFPLAYANTPVEHDDMGEGLTEWHEHEAHLPANGLHFWRPGQFGPVINGGDYLRIAAKFNNPHGRLIDNMALVVIFFEILPE